MLVLMRRVGETLIIGRDITVTVLSVKGHPVFAHAGQLTTETRNELFSHLPIRSIEDVVVFPLQLHRALWQLYHNGMEPTLDDALTIIGEVVTELPNAHTNTWEHMHAVKATRDFLQSLSSRRSDD